MNFITIAVQCPSQHTDILIAELFELGFDSFQEFEDGFEGSCEEGSFDERNVTNLLKNFESVSFQIKEQEKINWNEEWEKNYDPIIIDDKCIVRATFHEINKHYPYEIIISPKMSFGTGHHATTYQMLAHEMTLDFEGKKVLDVGTGTGVLSIMAVMKGADQVIATDIDDWCIENSRENFALNSMNNFILIQGEIEQVADHEFDIVLANINKNVLLSQMKDYAARLRVGGTLMLSGFYTEDIGELKKEAETLNLKETARSERDDWAMLVLSKQLV